MPETTKTAAPRRGARASAASKAAAPKTKATPAKAAPATVDAPEEAKPVVVELVHSRDTKSYSVFTVPEDVATDDNDKPIMTGSLYFPLGTSVAKVMFKNADAE